MIAADTSSVIAFLGGASGPDIITLRNALHHSNLVLPPVVLLEALSDPDAAPVVKALLEEIPLLDITEGYWHRAAHIRQRILAKGHKARLGDTLVAQSCIDHDMPLITRDKDFRHYAAHCGLRLYA